MSCRLVFRVHLTRRGPDMAVEVQGFPVAGRFWEGGVMLSVLASGVLVADPVERVGESGKRFATANVRTPTDDEPVFVNVACFDPAAIEAMLKLRKGDGISVVGTGKLNRWQKDGEQRVSLAVVGQQILSTYMVRTRRAA